MMITQTDQVLLSSFAGAPWWTGPTEVTNGARARGAAKPPPGASRRAPSPPALTGGEKCSEGAKVDWLTFTFRPDPDEHVPATVHGLLNLVLGGVQGVEAPGLFGYRAGVRFFIEHNGSPLHVGRVDYGGTHHKGRARVDLSGSGCAVVKSWPKLAKWIEGACDYTLTRVDLAVDCLRGEFGVDDAVEWYRAGEFNAGTSGRRPRHSTVGDWLDPHYGRTLEVGRRENGKMLRAYEKGRQLGDHVSPWVRFEVELRNVDRDLPLDILTRCSDYFVGAYACLNRILEAAAERIKTHQAEGEIALEKLCVHARSSYGQTIDCLRLMVSAEDLVSFLARPGIPKRLDKASLGGYLQNGSPPSFMTKESMP